MKRLYHPHFSGHNRSMYWRWYFIVKVVRSNFNWLIICMNVQFTATFKHIFSCRHLVVCYIFYVSMYIHSKTRLSLESSMVTIPSQIQTESTQYSMISSVSVYYIIDFDGKTILVLKVNKFIAIIVTNYLKYSYYS